METTWPKDLFTWIKDRTLYISTPFTWLLPKARELCLQSDFRYDRVVVGGPAVFLMPEYLDDVAEVRHEMNGILQKTNPLATRTTIGCPRKCRFCGVRRIEPEFKELEDWPDLPVICDNNLLASSEKHFNKVIDRLKKHETVDFNQGLDARLMTQFHADRIAELNNPTVRIAWDTADMEKDVLKAVAMLRKAKISRRNISCYVLIGFMDTPDEALYRLETIHFALGIKTFPMRYNPLNTLKKNSYVNSKRWWTDELLMDFMKYWSNTRYFKNLPFEKFDRKLRNAKQKQTPYFSAGLGKE